MTASTAGHCAADNTTAGTNVAGTNAAGTNTAGTNTAGTNTAGTNTAGTNTAGTNAAGTNESAGNTTGIVVADGFPTEAALRGWGTGSATTGQLFAEHALLPAGWAQRVLLQWDGDGQLTAVEPDANPPAGVLHAAGPLLPGLPNLHSHAFQRAMGGLTETRGPGEDSFWSWRTVMYRYAAALTPQLLEDLATWLYIEMLEAGYTSVCEFHYVHHSSDGTPYADDRTLALCLLRAAQRTGIGLTLLPVLYQCSGFGGGTPQAGQRRFVQSTERFLALLQRLQPDCAAQGARLGMAPHSLRAVPPDALQEALAGMASLDPQAPIHIHIAEQMGEVEGCLAWSGQRPVQWLLDHVAVDARWCLVHATHLDADEVVRAARSGAVAGLCPSTEANLGDGIFAWPAWQAAGGRWGVGSDSHVCVNAAEELMLLEYSQRLATHQRNVAVQRQQPWVATALLQAAVAGGAQASGRAVAGLAVGQQADGVVLDAAHDALLGLSCPQQRLSAHVFASHRQSAIESVWVGGQQRVHQGRHPLRQSARSAFQAAREQLQQRGRG